MVSVLAQIQTRHLLNTSKRNYHMSQVVLCKYINVYDSGSLWLAHSYDFELSQKINYILNFTIGCMEHI